MQTIFGVEVTEFIFWSLFVLLTIGEILVVYVFKLPKENVIRDWVEPAFEAIIIAIVIRTFFIQAFKIPTSSMEDTLLINDQIIANKFIYGTTLPWQKHKAWKFTTPKRGDVIIFRYPNDPRMMFIKRCMGLPGDMLQMKDKVLYINGKKLDEKYTYHKDLRIFPGSYAPRDNWGPIGVPDGCIWAMGDNRDMSSDSRFWGFLPYDYLRGKAWIVYWPPSRWRVIKHEKVDVPEPAGNTAPAKAPAFKAAPVTPN
jgi:signal peptidase I